MGYWQAPKLVGHLSRPFSSHSTIRFQKRKNPHGFPFSMRVLRPHQRLCLSVTRRLFSDLFDTQTYF